MQAATSGTDWLTILRRFGGLTALTAALVAAGCGDSGSPMPPDAGDGGTDGDAGETMAELTIEPSLQDFGSVGVGSTSEEVTFTVTNEGTGMSRALSSTLAGDGVFELATNNCMDAVLAPDETCTIGAVFEPSEEGSASATLTVSDGAAMASATLEGEGATGDLTITPTPHDFGDVEVGMTSDETTFTVENMGSVDSGDVSVSLGGTNPLEFEIVSDGCSDSTLAAGSTCEVTVSYAPSEADSHAADLNASAEPGGMATASLTGTGFDPAALRMTPTTREFGSVKVGSMSETVDLTVENVGGADTGTITQSLTGDTDSFEVTASGCMDVVLAGGDTCTISVRFAPGSGGAKTATLDVSADPGGSATSTLSGDANNSALEITPTPHDFGEVTVGGTSDSAQTFTVTNTGSAATDTLGTAIAGDHPGDFSVVSDGCAGSTLAAGADCTIALEFQPSAAGDRAASLTVTDPSTDSVSAAMNGTGLDAASLSISPPSQNFGSVGTDTASSDVVFTVTNDGDETSGTPSVGLSGANAGQFNVVSDGCTTTLDGGDSCNITVRFEPSTTGDKSASLDVSASPGGSVSASLSGVGRDPSDLGISPTTQSYTTTEGETTSPVTFTVTNGTAGVASTEALSVSIAGADAADFAIDSDGCSGTMLAGGASCEVSVVFAPGTPGTGKSATLTVQEPTGDQSVSADLSGDGLDDIDIDPDSNDFGNVRIGSNNNFTFEVSVNGADRTLDAINIGGADATDFNIVSGGGTTCMVDDTLTAGTDTCDIEVRFAPSGSEGSRSATLTVTGDMGATTTADLIGNATGPVEVVDPTTLPHDFGDIVVGQTATRTFSFENKSSSETATISTTPSFSGSFAIAGDTCSGNTLAAYNGMEDDGGPDECTVTVRFYPQSTVDYSGSFTLTYGSSSTTVDVEGAGISDVTLDITGTTDFGDVVATGSASRTLTVENTGGTTSANLKAASLSTGGLFSITGGTCPSSGDAGGDDQLDPGETCTIVVELAPGKTTTPGDYSDTVSIDDGSATASTGIDATAESMLSASPASESYPDTNEGETSSSTTFTVDNNGTVATASLVTGLGGTNPGEFDITGNTCPASLASGGSCSIDVEFAPSSDGSFTAELRVSDGTFGSNDGAQATSDLDGNGVALPELVITPSSKDYGSVLTGSNSDSFTFTVENAGALASGSLTTTASGDFNITGDTCGGSTLGSGSTCAVDVRFSPSSSGTHSETLTVEDSTDGSIVDTASLAGEGHDGTGADITGTPTPYDFGSVSTGSTSGTQTFTFTNIGDADASSITASTSGAFAIVDDRCGSSLNAGDSCEIDVEFAPGSAGSHQGSLTLGSGDIALTGTGLAAASLTVTPSSASYGDVAVGSTDSATFEIENSGDLDSGSLSTALTGADTPHFSIVSDGCDGTTLGGGDSCQFDVQFAPTTTGAKSAAVDVNEGGSDLADPSLDGTGVQDASLSISPSADQDCGNEPAGTSTTCVDTFTISNGGGVETGTLDITLSDGTNFAMGPSTTCADGGIIAAGGSCDIELDFEPQTVGSHSTDLTVSASPGGTVSVGLSGDAGSALTVSGDSGSFGDVDAGDASTAQTYTFDNNASSPSTGVLDVTVSGTDADMFDVVSDGCSGVSLTGGDCDVSVRFVPTDTGDRSATLEVTDGTADKTATVSMDGTGQSP